MRREGGEREKGQESVKCKQTGKPHDLSANLG